MLFHGCLTLLLIVILLFDVSRYIIPNWVVGILLALWPVMLWMQPLPEDYSIWLSLAVAVAVFAVGLAIFAMNWMGGGDIKLLTVLALWAGVESVMTFLVLMGLIGGALVFGLLLTRPLAGRLAKGSDPLSLPRVLRHGEPIPYGVAIALGFLIVLWLGDIPGLPV